VSPALRVMRPSEDETGGCAYLEESCVLYCRIGDLKADLENQDDVEWDEHESTGCVEKRDHWRWLFSGKPFDEECASAVCNAGRRNYKVHQARHRVREAATNLPPFTLNDMQAGLC